MRRTFEHLYNIGDTVYHATPDSDIGIIINISYAVRSNDILYEVAFGRFTADCVWCQEGELTQNKVF